MQGIRNIPALDGLRGLAVIIVIIGHAWFFGWTHMPYAERGSTLGVMLFFSLSGFLMAHHYLPGQLSLRYWLKFIVRRFFRVYPNFIFVLSALWVLCVIFEIPIVDYKNIISWKLIFRHLILIEERSVFWTIAVEFQFYLLLPLIASVILMFKPKQKSLLYVWTAIWLTSCIVDMLGMLSHANMIRVWYHLPFFTGGITMGLAYRCVPDTQFQNIVWSVIAMGIATLGYQLVFNTTFFILDNSPKKGYASIAMMSALTSLEVLAVAKSTSILKWLFSNPVSRYLGMISYSTYLVHVFILTSARDYVKAYFHPLTLPLAFCIIIAVASIVFFCIEKPSYSIGKRLAARIYR